MGNCQVPAFSPSDLPEAKMTRASIEETVLSVKSEYESMKVVIAEEKDLEETELESEKKRSSTYVSPDMGDDDDEEYGEITTMAITIDELHAFTQKEKTKLHEQHSKGVNLLYSHENKFTPTSSVENLSNLATKEEAVLKGDPKSGMKGDIPLTYNCTLVKRTLKEQGSFISWLGRRQTRVFVLENGVCTIYAQPLVDEDGYREYPFGINLKQSFDLTDYEIIMARPISEENECETCIIEREHEDGYSVSHDANFLLHKVRPDKPVQRFGVDEQGFIKEELKTRADIVIFCNSLILNPQTSGVHALFMTGSDRIRFVPQSHYNDLLLECNTGEDKELSMIVVDTETKFKHVLHFLMHIEYAQRVEENDRKSTKEKQRKADVALRQKLANGDKSA